METRDGAKQGGFTDPVWSDDCEQLAGIDVRVDAFEQPSPRNVQRNALERDHCARPPRR